MLPPAFQGGWLTGGLSGSKGTPAPSKKDALAPKHLCSLDARPALPSTRIAGAVSRAAGVGLNLPEAMGAGGGGC